MPTAAGDGSPRAAPGAFLHLAYYKYKSSDRPLGGVVLFPGLFTVSYANSVDVKYRFNWCFETFEHAKILFAAETRADKGKWLAASPIVTKEVRHADDIIRREHAKTAHESSAAASIQSAWLGHKARVAVSHLRALRQREEAVVTMQKIWRGSKDRTVFESKRQAAKATQLLQEQLENDSARIIQQAWRWFCEHSSLQREKYRLESLSTMFEEFAVDGQGHVTTGDVVSFCEGTGLTHALAEIDEAIAEMKGGTPDSEIKFPIFLAWANRQAEREQSIHEIDKQILVAGRLLADTGIPAEEQREQSIRDVEKQIADRLADTGISAEERRAQELGAWSLAQKKVAIPDGGPGEAERSEQDHDSKSSTNFSALHGDNQATKDLYAALRKLKVILASDKSSFRAARHNRVAPLQPWGVDHVILTHFFMHKVPDVVMQVTPMVEGFFREYGGDGTCEWKIYMWEFCTAYFKKDPCEFIREYHSPLEGLAATVPVAGIMEETDAAKDRSVLSGARAASNSEAVRGKKYASDDPSAARPAHRFATTGDFQRLYSISGFRLDLMADEDKLHERYTGASGGLSHEMDMTAPIVDQDENDDRARRSREKTERRREEWRRVEQAKSEMQANNLKEQLRKSRSAIFDNVGYMMSTHQTPSPRSPSSRTSRFRATQEDDAEDTATASPTKRQLTRFELVAQNRCADINTDRLLQQLEHDAAKSSEERERREAHKKKREKDRLEWAEARPVLGISDTARRTVLHPSPLENESLDFHHVLVDSSPRRTQLQQRVITPITTDGVVNLYPPSPVMAGASSPRARTRFLKQDSPSLHGVGSAKFQRIPWTRTSTTSHISRNMHDVEAELKASKRALANAERSADIGGRHSKGTSARVARLHHRIAELDVASRVQYRRALD